MAIENGDWPADMVTEVLLKLPVKSIVRFKCVAKTWFDLFRNPSFVSNYNRINKTKNRHLIVSYFKEEDQHLVRIFDDQNLVSHRDLFHQSPFPVSHPSSAQFCVEDGLVCLYDDDQSRLVIWNPATREFRMLPQCHQHISTPIKYICVDFGFGLDPLSNDYKVIFYFSYIDFSEPAEEYDYFWDPREVFICCVLYKMSSDSWRVLKEEDLNNFEDVVRISQNESNACANGVYYWNAEGKAISGSVNKVLGFNFSTEAFQLIDYPPLDNKGQLIALQDGRISVWDTHFLLDTKPSNEVWVLNDDGNWTKLLTIDTVVEVSKMCGLWENVKVFMQSLNGGLLLFDLENKELRELDIKSAEISVADITAPFALWVYIYEESLVSVRRE